MKLRNDAITISICCSILYLRDVGTTAECRRLMDAWGCATYGRVTRCGSTASGRRGLGARWPRDYCAMIQRRFRKGLLQPLPVDLDANLQKGEVQVIGSDQRKRPMN